MPPKESKKTELKKAQKIIEDKTFGLKNKNKSKTVQNYIKGIASQVTAKFTVQTGGEKKRLENEYAEKAAKKKEEEKQALLNALFKNVKKTQEIAASDESEEEEEKNDEIDLYTDQREQIYGKEEDEDMSAWDQSKLESVIQQQEQKYKYKNKTDKICKFFLDAVEHNKYGWRWVCPNGMECQYRHCLPPGYVLKRDGPAAVVDTKPLEERLEEERANLKGGTPVTLERFLKWKEDKKKQKEAEWEAKREAEAKKTGTKGFNALSGRALFKYDPNLFQDDLDALDEKEYEEEERKSDEEGSENGEDNREEGEDEEDNGEEDQNEKAEGEADGEGKTTETAGQEADTTGEAKKKKKKKKKKAAEGQGEADVKINEDVFLGEEDVELPEDDS